MSKNILNFIIAVSICFTTLLLMTPSEAWAGTADSASADSGSGQDQIHAGAAWDAYNSGNLTEAERQFVFLIDKSKQEKQTINNNTEEIFNLQLGLAYTQMKLGDLISSKDIFADLIQKKYKLTDCVPAILGILSQLKDYKTMDKYLPMLENLFSGQDLDKWDYLFAESAWAAYNAKNYQLAQRKFESLLQKQIIQKNLDGKMNPKNGTINPDTKATSDTKNNPDIKNNPDTASWVTGLGYTLYQQEKYEAAYELLNDFMGKNNIKSTAKIDELKLMICRKLADPLTSKVKKGKYGVPNGYDNIFYHRHKNGDNGTSRLDETGFVINSNSNNLDIFFKSRHLLNGASDSFPNKTGNFYKYLNGQKALFTSSNDNIIVNETALKWNTDKITLLSDFDLKLDTSLGISPLGGAVSPTPVIRVKADSNKGWNAEIHRTVVDDSILSMSGFDDPYSNQEWGRVVKNGINIGRNISFGKNDWFSLNGGFDAYRGVNMLKNSSLQLNAATGKTIPMQNGDEMTLGLYVTWMHFQHNSNFYTFGHGGYYSPDFMFTAGPLFRYKTASCKDYSMDFQLSVGWMKEKNADAEKYPVHYEIVDEFTASALDELKGVHAGNTSSTMTGSMKLEGWKIMTDNLAAGGFFSMNAASEDLEWRIGAGIEYCFDSRSVFIHNPIFKENL
ncbi:MAG: BCSC C-terminal domain-containing protein [Desulfamplus sp.]|nr:BCSC C-terminal domain-containing protein [Desulfamplus sp.]